MRFVILGPPRTKKNHQQIRINRRTGARFIAQADTARSWEEMAVLQLAAQFRKQSASGAAHASAKNLKALFYRERDTGDLGNFLSAACDALERAGIVVNDRLIRGFDGSRLLLDRENPRVELELTEMP